ncbi:MAG: xanthine dehydrogenase family protein subunit M [Elusimicrobia bacterium]|nr:xanthine dehydrogenase family protein subunit M [Elusimicrobiota bacterium]
MPIITEFEYVKPKTLAEGLKILSKNREKAKILSGGTDLVVKLKDETEKPDIVVDIKGIPGLDRIEFKNNILSIGALATFTDLLESKIVKTRFPLLWETANTVASVGVRNRATIAGNLCSAVPSADSAPALLVYEAVVCARNLKAVRKIPVNKWFAGPKKTVLRADEIVISVEIPLPQKRHAGCYVKMSRYEGEDLAQGGIAVLAFMDNKYKIAACALGPKPERCVKTEAFLNGKEIYDAAIDEAKNLIVKEISPITDIRSSKEYRIHMTQVMLERGLKTAVARLSGKGPRYGEHLI